VKRWNRCVEVEGGGLRWKVILVSFLYIYSKCAFFKIPFTLWLNFVCVSKNCPIQWVRGGGSSIHGSKAFRSMKLSIQLYRVNRYSMSGALCPVPLCLHVLLLRLNDIFLSLAFNVYLLLSSP
jgi:hypothetical protein